MAMFDSREQAGKTLAAALQETASLNPAVYALPRGGLPVAVAVAERLGAPLDIVLVRKLGAPGHKELAIGAVVDGPAPTVVLHRDILHELGVSQNYLDQARKDALLEIERRRKIYVGNREPVSPKGRTVILVDDGLATGATMETAVKAMRKAGAGQIIVAVPTAPVDAAEKFHRLADKFVCLETPEPFWAVGNQYRNFPQLTDDDVIDILKRFDRRAGSDGGVRIARYDNDTLSEPSPARIVEVI
jgi:predicted phosphoribosyltransferase